MLYYIILSILEFSISFSASHNYVTCDNDICDHPVTRITLLSHYTLCLSKIKVKIKIKEKEDKEDK